MKPKLSNFLKTQPVFIWLLPVFFVLHGYNEFYPLLPVKESITLTGIYLLAALILFGIAFLLFRNKYKTALFVFLLFSINFFFGPIHDWLKVNFPGSFPSRYVFILPAIFLFIILLAVLLKKRKKTLYLITQYLNLLLIALLLFDIVTLATKKPSHQAITDLKKEGFTDCTSCDKPDVYYILADEYAGEKQLKDVFNFDNTPFINELKKRGFHIVEDSRSNYNYTMFSAPSILNMDFIYGIEGHNQSIHDKVICMDAMKNNRTFRFFKSLGYRTYNYSIFDVPGQPTLAKPSFLPVKTRPLTSQTFLARVQDDLWYHLVTDLDLVVAKKSAIYNDGKNNTKFLELTKKLAAEKTSKPKFVYTHLMMPHYPYYFTKEGKETPYENLGGEFDSQGDRYISYLQYSNPLFLELIDAIKSSSEKPPIIIFMSDHGFKSFKNYAMKETYFTNFNAVYFPDSNYSQYYKGLSNVNQFRTILNSQFHQKLPLLKDSSSLLLE